LISTFLFDLDDTLLDRDKTIEPFIRDQYDRFELHQIHYEKYKKRFIEMDNHGYFDKHKLYQMLITEFELTISIEDFVVDFLQRVHIPVFCLRCGRRRIVVPPAKHQMIQ
jgi:putative hydrolase of the HAD superfamily